MVHPLRHPMVYPWYPRAVRHEGAFTLVGYAVERSSVAQHRPWVRYRGPHA